MPSSPLLRGKELVTNDMPDDAMRRSRYHVKRCFAKYIEKGRRIIKLHNLMEEMEHVIDDNNERNQLLEGNLGFLMSCTQEAAVDPPYVACSKAKSWSKLRICKSEL